MKIESCLGRFMFQKMLRHCMLNEYHFLASHRDTQPKDGLIVFDMSIKTDSFDESRLDKFMKKHIRPLNGLSLTIIADSPFFVHVEFFESVKL